MKRKIGHGHVFDDPDKKAEMLAYRQNGCSYPQLALYYGTDHTTILYHCKKAGLVTLKKAEKKKIVELVADGMSPKDVAIQFKTTESTVVTYCKMAGMIGQKIVMPTPLMVLQIKPPMNRVRESRGEGIPEYQKTPSARPGWIEDTYEGWICAGKSLRELQVIAKERQRKAEEQKRIDLLTY